MTEAEGPKRVVASGHEVVSVIIPSWRGNVDRVLRSLEAQTFRDYALYVIRHVSPASRARNVGVAASEGEFVLFIDDDAYLGHERVLERLVAVLRADATVGIAGPSKLIPPGATALQRRVATEVPRWIYPVVLTETESNPPLEGYGFTGITTTCAIMRRTTFDTVGGFDERLPTGPEDTDFFYRLRRRGFRFVIPASCWVYHDPPGTFRALLRKSFHYGIGHALETRKAPERRMAVIPLQTWYGKLFVICSPLLFPPSLFLSLYLDPVRQWKVGFRPLKAVSTFATLYGYTWGWFHGAA